MKNKPFASKSTRTKIFTVISLVSILLLLALNIWVTKFGIFGNAYIDMTEEGLYTLTPEMKNACDNLFDELDGEIEIIFCDDRDHIIKDISTRVVYYMAVAMSKRADNLTVSAVNVNMNPTAVAQYKTTSLTEIDSGNIIISYDSGAKANGVNNSRYRVVRADNFWRAWSDNRVYSYDGEYQMMSYIMSLTLVDRPAAYFVTDHEETYYDVTNPENPMNRETGVFVDLLHDRGFEVKNLSISELITEAEKESAETGKTVIPRIPDDCILLIINNPKTDFRYDSDKATSFAYVSETEILDRYMTEERGSIMVSLDYDSARLNNGGEKLSNLEDFLAEWGIECTGLKVTDDKNFVDNTRNDHSTIIADYELEAETYASSIYGTFASMTSSPRLVIDDSGVLRTSFGIGQSANEPGSAQTLRIFTPFIYSMGDSLTYTKDDYGEYNTLADDGKQIVAALGSRQTTDQDNGNLTFSYVFCSASPTFFSSDILGNASYANFDIISSLVQDICRLESYADESLGGDGANNKKLFGKVLVDPAIRDADEHKQIFVEGGSTESVSTLGLTDSRRAWATVIVFIAPVVIAIVGVVVTVRRKYL